MTRRIEKPLVALTVAALAGTAMASETITYTYDASGRLVKVARSGSVNNNVSADYSYDRADNRINVTVASSNPPPPAPPPPPTPPPPPNTPPTPVNDTGAQQKCTIESYNVTANDTDPDGDYPLSLVSVTGTGFSVVSSTTIQFVSTASAGAKVGTYTVQDSRGATATATLTVTVSGVCQ